MNVYCLFTAQVGVEAELTEAVAVGSVDYVIPVTDCTRSDGLRIESVDRYVHITATGLPYTTL